LVACRGENDEEHWCSWIEKAYAKAMSNYWQMQYTDATVAMKFLNNAPTIYHMSAYTSAEGF